VPLPCSAVPPPLPSSPLPHGDRRSRPPAATRARAGTSRKGSHEVFFECLGFLGGGLAPALDFAAALALVLVLVVLALRLALSAPAAFSASATRRRTGPGAMARVRTAAGRKEREGPSVRSLTASVRSRQDVTLTGENARRV